MARRTSGSSSTVNKTGFGIFVRCGARDFVASYEDGGIASVSFRAALKLQFLTVPCPAPSINSSRVSLPRMHPIGSRPQAKYMAWDGQREGLPFLNGGPRTSSPRYYRDRSRK